MNTKLVALVTGASSGIGADIARDLAVRGWNIVLVARRRERLAALADELAANYRVRCHVLAADLGDRGQLGEVVAGAARWAQGEGLTLAALVNNAGSGVWRHFEEVPREIAQRDIDLNVTALTTLTHDFLAVAKAHGQRAYVLNIGSLAGILPTARYAVYSGTKAYVKQFTEILAYELRDTPVTVTCICPGGVKTEFVALAGQELKKDLGMMESPVVARISVDAMLAGEVICVPGFLNKVSALARFLPRPLKMRLVERSMHMAVQEK